MSGLDSIVDAEIVLSSDEWAARIRGHLGQAVEGIVAAGRDLIAAKADVRHGEWLPMLKEIGISEPESRRLQAIGREFSNRPNLDDLPRSVTALYELSRVPADEIESGIESGDITPDMTIKDAKRFARPEPEPAPKPEPEPQPEPPRPEPAPLPPGFAPGDLDELNVKGFDRRELGTVGRHNPVPPEERELPNRRKPILEDARALRDELDRTNRKVQRLMEDNRVNKNKTDLRNCLFHSFAELSATIADASANLIGENK